MNAVTYQFHLHVISVRSRPDQPWSSVGIRVHSIIEMSHMAGSCLKSLHGRIIVCTGMGQREYHLALLLGDQFHGPFPFWRNIQKLYPIPGSLIQPVEHVHVWYMDKLPVLSPFLIRSNKRPFHIDTIKIRPLI